MLTNFFGKSKPITVLVILGLFLCLFLISVFNGKIVDSYIETFLLLLLMFALVIFINTKNNLSFDNSYVFLIFVLLIGIFPASFKIDTAFYANLIILFFLRKIYSLQSAKKTLKKLFDSGFWLGIVFFIEPFSLTFGILIYLSVFLYQHLDLQKILISLIGLFVPVFLVFTYYFWFDKMEEFILFFDWYTYYDLSMYSQLNFLIAIYVVLFSVLFAILIKTPKALAVKNDFRKNWILVLFNFICAVTLIILTKNKTGSEFLYLTFPTAIIITNLIEVYEKKWLMDVFMAFLIVFSFSMCII